MSGGVYVISGNVLAGLWALSGLAVSLAMTYALAANEKLSTDDVPIYVIGLVLFAGDGLLGLGLSAVGWKDGVTWVLRWMPLLAVAGVAIQVIRTQKRTLGAILSWVALGSSQALVSLFGFIAAPHDALARAEVPGIPVLPTTLELIPIWFDVGAAALGLASLVFGLLFLRALLEGSHLRVETNWGGPGGGGGWRMTSSLAYLVASLAFGLLFGVFVLRLDDRDMARRFDASVQQALASRAPPSPSPSGAAPASPVPAATVPTSAGGSTMPSSAPASVPASPPSAPSPPKPASSV